MPSELSFISNNLDISLGVVFSMKQTGLVSLAIFVIYRARAFLSPFVDKFHQFLKLTDHNISWKKPRSLPLFYSLDERYHNVDDEFIRYQSCSILFAVYKKIQKSENVLSFNSVINSCFDGRSVMYFQA